MHYEYPVSSIGHYYLKVGHGHDPRYEKVVATAAQVSDWYCREPTEDMKEGLGDFLNLLFPGIGPISWS